MWHSIDGWLRSGNWAPTFQGVATLVGVFVALITVIWQIRSSSKQVQDQIKAQREAEREQRERQERAIATAILFEIDSFCMIELDLVDKNLAGSDPASNNLPSAVGMRTNISEIYKGLSPLLGSLNARSVSAIVKFYSMVGSYEGLWRSYQFSLDMLRAPANAAVRMDPQSLVSDAKAQLKGIRDLIPKVKALAGDVTTAVAHDCGVDELIGRGNAQTR